MRILALQKAPLLQFREKRAKLEKGMGDEDFLWDFKNAMQHEQFDFSNSYNNDIIYPVICIAIGMEIDQRFSL